MQVTHPIFLGETLVTSSVLHRTNPITGTSTTVTYRGTKDQIDDILAQANEDGIEASQAQNRGPYYECQCVFPYEFGTSPEPIAIWEVSQEMNSRSIWNMPKVTKEASTWAAAVAKSVQEYKKIIEDAFNGGTVIDPANIDTVTYPISAQVLRELSSGSDVWEDSCIVLRRRQNIASRYAPTTKINATRVIYTTSQLISTYSIPSDVQNVLPSDPSETPDSYHVWGWKERPSTRQFVGQRVEITNEWVFACWSTFLYDLMT